jgi:haloacetate dehalogenase
MCNDYRANATFDRELDEADRAQHRQIHCPVLVLWGARDDLPRFYGNPLNIWHNWAQNVTGCGIDCGHYLAEEVPDETYSELERFLRPY